VELSRDAIMPITAEVANILNLLGQDDVPEEAWDTKAAKPESAPKKLMSEQLKDAAKSCAIM
jgi:hypothetical protein